MGWDGSYQYSKWKEKEREKWFQYGNTQNRPIAASNSNRVIINGFSRSLILTHNVTTLATQLECQTNQQNRVSGLSLAPYVPLKKCLILIEKEVLGSRIYPNLSKSVPSMPSGLNPMTGPIVPIGSISPIGPIVSMGLIAPIVGPMVPVDPPTDWTVPDRVAPAQFPYSSSFHVRWIEDFEFCVDNGGFWLLDPSELFISDDQYLIGETNYSQATSHSPLQCPYWDRENVINPLHLKSFYILHWYIRRMTNGSCRLTVSLYIDGLYIHL